jgi:hypothetical protein
VRVGCEERSRQLLVRGVPARVKQPRCAVPADLGRHAARAAAAAAIRFFPCAFPFPGPSRPRLRALALSPLPVLLRLALRRLPRRPGPRRRLRRLVPAGLLPLAALAAAVLVHVVRLGLNQQLQLRVQPARALDAQPRQRLRRLVRAAAAAARRGPSRRAGIPSGRLRGLRLRPGRGRSLPGAIARRCRRRSPGWRRRGHGCGRGGLSLALGFAGPGPACCTATARSWPLGIHGAPRVARARRLRVAGLRAAQDGGRGQLGARTRIAAKVQGESCERAGRACKLVHAKLEGRTQYHAADHSAHAQPIDGRSSRAHRELGRRAVRGLRRRGRVEAVGARQLAAQQPHRAGLPQPRALRPHAQPCKSRSRAHAASGNPSCDAAQAVSL